MENGSEHLILAGVLPKHLPRMEKVQLNLITPNHFDNPTLREIYQFMDMYYSKHLAVIPEWALKERAESKGHDVGHVVSLVEAYRNLSNITVQDHEFSEALALIKDRDITHKLAQAIVASREMLQDEHLDEASGEVFRGQEDARRFLTETLQELESVEAEAAPEGDIVDDLDRLWKEYETVESNPDVQGGVKWGIAEVDEYTGGVRPGELALVAGFTASGKSTLVAALAWSTLVAGKNVLMFTTETTREEMEIRILARHSRLPKFRTPGGIDSHQIMSGSLSENHKRVFRAVLQDFRETTSYGKLFMVQMPANGSVDYVYTKSAQYNRRNEIDLIIVDSINLLRSVKRYNSKREMLEDLLQDFKRFASAFDNGRGVAVVSPWQMSRNAWREATEAGGVYSLASLADSSEAEKPLTLYTEVLTPSGYTPIGSLNVGDTLIHPRGGTQAVEEITDNPDPLPIYLVHTNDGGIISCSPGHLWTVREDSSQEWEVMTAQQIMASGKSYEIPPFEAGRDLSMGTDSDLPLHPFLLGILLRSSSNGRLEATSQWISEVLYAMRSAPETMMPDYLMESEEEITLGWVYHQFRALAPDFGALMEECNVLEGNPDEFRIPASYLNAPFDSRLNLLKGLAGEPYQDLTSENLPLDHPSYGEAVRWLALSVGLFPYDDGVRRIVGVEDTGTKDLTRCIRVSNPDGLFTTEEFITTHNSASQILTLFKDGDRVNIQILKNRGGREMPKVSYRYDYRNSYIGTSSEDSEDEDSSGSSGLRTLVGKGWK